MRGFTGITQGRLSSAREDERQNGNTQKPGNDIKGGTSALEQGHNGKHGRSLNLGCLSFATAELP